MGDSDVDKTDEVRERLEDGDEDGVTTDEDSEPLFTVDGDDDEAEGDEE